MKKRHVDFSRLHLFSVDAFVEAALTRTGEGTLDLTTDENRALFGEWMKSLFRHALVEIEFSHSRGIEKALVEVGRLMRDRDYADRRLRREKREEDRGWVSGLDEAEHEEDKARRMWLRRLENHPVLMGDPDHVERRDAIVAKRKRRPSKPEG